jgi:Tfp pilus assembly protein PilO
MKGKPSAGVIAGIVGGLLVYALAGYFLLVSPQRGKAGQLKKDTATTQQQIDQYRLAAAQTRNAPPIRAAELFRLTKAMPDEVDMADVILELSQIAKESGIEFDTITPQAPAVQSGFSSIPITLDFDGNYYELSDFIFRIRNLVRVRGGVLDAKGRLFTVDSISFSESPLAFPRIKATLSIHAFTYGDATTTAAAAPAPTPATTPGSETTSTTTTGTPPATPPPATTPPASPDTPPEGASASGAVTP